MLDRFRKYILGDNIELSKDEISHLSKAAKVVLGKPIIIAQPCALKPILGSVGERKQNNVYFTPRALSFDDAMFPITQAVAIATVDEYWAKHKANACHSFNQLHQYGAMLGFHNEFSDVSLYDATRLIAAAAHCFSTHEDIILLAGSINGIQDYLYDLVSKNAAKLLKGRSFYLQLLVDTIIKKVQEKLAITDKHIVYASGGGFFILAPKAMAADFKAICQNVADEIYQKHKTSLFVSFAESKIINEQSDISEIWSDLINKLNRQKYKRLNNKLLKNYDAFFEATEIGGLELRDEVTGEEITNKENAKKLRDTTGVVSETTHKQIGLGRFLSRTAAWVTTDKGKDDVNESEHFYYEVLEREWIHLFSKDFNHISKEAIFLNQPEKNNFVLYGGNQIPLNEDGTPKSFTALATKDVNETLKRLAILRMDVDNLGTLFKEGLLNPSLAQYATMSSHLDLFFKAYLNQLRAQFADNVIIVYSGGDDLFIVGKWNEVIELSILIYEYFKKWTCNNPNLTISGGISIVDDKFPIMQAARMAADVEDKAKDHIYNSIEKNAINLFGVSLNWEYEMSIVRELRKLLLYHLQDDKNFSRNFLGKIHQHAEMQKNQRKNKHTESWRWMIAYDFARYKSKVKMSKAQEDFIDALSLACFTDKFDNKKLLGNHTFLTLLQVAARWVALETKRKME